jgi:cation:H+ antiporter
MNPWVALLIGVVCAGIGGELFVRGAVGLATWARVSAGIIGATVAAFATSSPELSVAIGSSAAGQPEISLGDAVGSNVVNVGLILGLALCISGIQAPRASVRRDFPVALLVPVILGVLSLDGMISRVDGILLLTLFAGWLIAVTIAVRRERSASAQILGAPNPWRAVLASLVGLAFLVASGHFIVTGARGIAVTFFIPEFIIGATVVAIGTSMPELATSIISKLRGHDEIGLGTILGSNIFNGLFIVGVAAVICPIRVDARPVATALVIGLATTALTFPPSGGLIERRRGAMLLALYAIYVVALVSH